MAVIDSDRTVHESSINTRPNLSTSRLIVIKRSARDGTGSAPLPWKSGALVPRQKVSEKPKGFSPRDAAIDKDQSCSKSHPLTNPPENPASNTERNRSSAPIAPANRQTRRIDKSRPVEDRAGKTSADSLWQKPFLGAPQTRRGKRGVFRLGCIAGKSVILKRPG